MTDKTMILTQNHLLDVGLGGVTLHIHVDEDGEEYYHAMLTLCVEDGTDEGHWVIMDTTINHPCKVCAAQAAAMTIGTLAEGCVPTVLVFEANIGFKEEFDMTDPPEHLDENFSPKETRVLH